MQSVVSKSLYKIYNFLVLTNSFESFLGAWSWTECIFIFCNSSLIYSEVPNRPADRNKRAGLEKNATLLAYSLSKSINEQGGIFRLLNENMSMPNNMIS